MPGVVFERALQRVAAYCSLTGQRKLHVHFHGGEPFLVGARRFDLWCTRLRTELANLDTLEIGIQTNGTLVTEEWASALRKHQVQVGVSVDGPKSVHDRFRVDHKGRGSYDEVVRGLDLLQRSGVECGILSVIQPGADPLVVHQHLGTLGTKRITYILPDFTHDNIEAIREEYGQTPCSDFLIPIFDYWWFNQTMELRVVDLWNIARIVMGGGSQIETYGNRPPRYVFIESNGDIEGLDCLRSCKEGLASTALNVEDDDIAKILTSSTMHANAIFRGLPLPTACRKCPERETCAGGYLPHRYSLGNGFDNPSVWCEDILKLFRHIRSRMKVTVRGTQKRRRMLQELSCT